MTYYSYLRELAEKEIIAGYTDTYFPEEYLYALSIHPVRIMSDEDEPHLADAYIQGFCCPYAKNLLEQALKNKLSFLSAVFFTRYCDSLRGVYEVWKTEKLSPYVGYIRYSQVTKDTAVEYLKEEFIHVFSDLARHFDRTLRPELLKEAIKVVNNKRKLIENLYKARKEGVLNIKSRDFYSIIFSSTYLKINDFLDRISKINLTAGNERKGIRVVLSATEMDNLRFFDLIDQIGFYLISDDLASGTRYFKDLVEEGGESLSELSANIARRYIKKPPCSVKEPSDRRIEELIYEVRSSEAKGVIFFRTSFCDSEGLEYPFIKERLEKEKIPHIYIESDHRLSNYQQIKTRLEAFYEQLGENI